MPVERVLPSLLSVADVVSRVLRLTVIVWAWALFALGVASPFLALFTHNSDWWPGLVGIPMAFLMGIVVVSDKIGDAHAKPETPKSDSSQKASSS